MMREAEPSLILSQTGREPANQSSGSTSLEIIANSKVLKAASLPAQKLLE
ncbi:MAG TPA: hypothetical protein VN754_10745 [Candidatus Binataceae bacterium]|nr:hypothetical protein [Candidatus Binataceae bacterium]